MLTALPVPTRLQALPLPPQAEGSPRQGSAVAQGSSYHLGRPFFPSETKEWTLKTTPRSRRACSEPDSQASTSEGCEKPVGKKPRGESGAPKDLGLRAATWLFTMCPARNCPAKRGSASPSRAPTGLHLGLPRGCDFF